MQEDNIHSKSHRSFVAVHSGVQFCTEDNSGYTADILTATLLMIACSKPQINLSKVRINVPFVTQQIHNVSLGKSQSIQSLKFDIAGGAFCKANVVTVALTGSLVQRMSLDCCLLFLLTALSN